MPARFVNPGFLTMTQRELTHSHVAGLWLGILGEYFKINEYFMTEPEYTLIHGRDRADTAIIRVSAVQGGRDATCILLEVKPASSSETWDNARAQTYGYVVEGLRKKRHSTIVIIAKGLEFVMFEVPGSQMGSGADWISLGLNNDGSQHPAGTPYSINDHTDQLERILLDIKEEATNGKYENS